MARITISVTNKELDAFEDLATAWNLCNKHNAAINASEEDLFRFTRKCGKCVENNKKIKRKALRLWRKMVIAYDKKRKRRTR